MKKSFTQFFRLIIVLITACCFTNIGFSLPVFPGAMGHGTDTIAGRGGQIIKVTNLNDSGTGSLRAAVDTNGPRIIVFEVSGTIVLGSILTISKPYLTLAGQTAPSPGINLRGAGIRITTHNVLVQHLRVRVGDDPSGPNPDIRDAIEVLGTSAYNVVVDHMSGAWSIDENLSTWYALNNVTFSANLITEALHCSLHSKGCHGMGGMLGDKAHNVTMIRNLFSHNNARNPRIKADVTTEIVNNVFYNSGGGWCALGGAPGTKVLASFVGNKWIAGVNSDATARAIGVQSEQGSDTKIYLNDNWVTSGIVSNQSSFHVSTPPIWHSSIVTMPNSEVEAWVVANAGARPADRDAVDIRAVNSLINRTGAIINSQNNVGGWPVLAQNSRTFVIPNDPHGDVNGDGYTNIEDVLHQMAAEVEGRGVLAAPGSFAATKAASPDNYRKINLSWADVANESGYKIERKRSWGQTDFVQIATVGSNVTSYSDSTCGDATTYAYRVRAYNASGNGNYSAQASATTDLVTSGLRGMWKFAEGTGTTTADSSGNANNGTISGATWVTGTKTYGLDFDGVDDVVNCGSGSTLDNLAAVTVAAWIKADTLGEGSIGRIAVKGAGVTGGWQFMIRDTNQLSFAVDYSTTDMKRWSATNAIALGAWRHVVATWTGSATATNVKFYVNGVQTAYGTTSNGSGSRVDDAAANFLIGNESGGTRTFDGSIDQVRTFNRVLTANEILAVYRNSQSL